MKKFLATAALVSASLIFLGSDTAFGQGLQTTSAVRGAQPMPPASTVSTDAQINAEALGKTQNLLRNPSERQKAIATDPKAKAADQSAKSLLGSNTEKAYEISAQLMEKIVSETGGDPQRMQKLMLELQSNPHLLEKYLTPTQRDMIRQMASDVEKSKGYSPAHGSGR